MERTNEEIIKQHQVDIHGKKYLTVAGRVLLAHNSVGEEKDLSIITELVSADEKIVLFKATVTLGDCSYTGYATSIIAKGKLEATSPYETAETSAVGRALGFAGFGVTEGIATYDELKASGAVEQMTYQNGTELFKKVYSQVVAAKKYSDINAIFKTEDYKKLSFQEKQDMSRRINKAMERVNHDEN